jgi:O-antigen ligase
MFKYFPYNILCLLFVAVEWILLNPLAPKCEFIPYRLTYCCGVICVSINILCAWAFQQFKTCICILIIQFVLLFFTKFIFLYFINFTVTSLAGQAVVIVVLGNEVSLSFLKGLVHSEHERHARSKLGQHNYILIHGDTISHFFQRHIKLHTWHKTSKPNCILIGGYAISHFFQKHIKLLAQNFHTGTVY